MISVSNNPRLKDSLNIHMHTHICIHVCNCARTYQRLETELQDEDAESSDDESGARLEGASQDQRGTVKYHGKVACCMWYNTLVLPLCTNHVTPTDVGPRLLYYSDE